MTLLAPRERTVGIATVAVEGWSPSQLHRLLWGEHRIRTSPVDTPEVRGVRVSPGLHTTTAELDRFIAVMRKALQEGPPPA